MPVSKDFLLSKLPEFRDERVVRAEKQEVRRDIMPLIFAAHKRNAWLYDKIGKYFIGENINQTCDNLFEFCRENLRYDEEDDQLQTVSVPQGLLTAGHCDCKGYASFICGCLGAIERYTGEAIDWHYCFASYKIDERTPYHVFSVVNTYDGPVWVDPTPGASGKTPFWWVNIKVKNSGMLEEVIGSINGPDSSYKVGLISKDIIRNPFNTIPVTSAAQQTLASDVLLSAVSQPDTSVSSSPPIIETITPPPVGVEPVTANVAVVTAAPAGAGVLEKMGIPVTDNEALIGVCGLAALYFLTKRKRSVSGIGKKKKSVLPIVLIGGVAAYWLYTKSQSDTPVAAVPVTNYPDTPDLTLTPTPGTPAPPPPIVAPTAVADAGRSYTAMSDEFALKRDWPDLYISIRQMTDSEVISMYNYFYGYVLPGLKLYRLSGATGVYPDGNWNTPLYDAIAAIKIKYGLNI